MRYDELLEAGEKEMKEKALFDALAFYGTETGYTRVTNNEFFKTIAFKLRTIDARPADTRTSLFGCEVSTPILAGDMSNPRAGGMKCFECQRVFPNNQIESSLQNVGSE
jgi:isopentenyl diphosphate isomerase/L-lactate dehydrogenase-like FMN-dependent dehydrogenase